MTDLGPVRCFLGIEIESDRPRRILHIHQQRAVRDLLATNGFSDCNGHWTPQPRDVVRSLTRAASSCVESHHIRVSRFFRFSAILPKPIQHTEEFIAPPNLYHNLDILQFHTLRVISRASCIEPSICYHLRVVRQGCLIATCLATYDWIGLRCTSA